MSNTPVNTYPCPFRCGRNFSRPYDAARHAREVSHGGNDTTRFCSIPGCNWKGKRPKRFEKHMAAKHNIELDVPLDFIASTASTTAHQNLQHAQIQGSARRGTNSSASQSLQPSLLNTNVNLDSNHVSAFNSGSSGSGTDVYYTRPPHQPLPSQHFSWQQGQEIRPIVASSFSFSTNVPTGGADPVTQMPGVGDSTESDYGPQQNGAGAHHKNVSAQ